MCGHYTQLGSHAGWVWLCYLQQHLPFLYHNFVGQRPFPGTFFHRLLLLQSLSALLPFFILFRNRNGRVWMRGASTFTISLNQTLLLSPLPPDPPTLSVLTAPHLVPLSFFSFHPLPSLSLSLHITTPTPS
eukprot:GILI01034508.1.p1 GENE.GILI01034508.1~~GILI01034508.1.p1  ORF type:complete len:131 (+),score=10.45 GILI01034508.1:262-654(+)